MKSLFKDKRQILALLGVSFLSIIIGIIAYYLIAPKKKDSTFSSVKTKAAGKTYRKEIALGLSDLLTPPVEEPEDTFVEESIDDTAQEEAELPIAQAAQEEEPLEEPTSTPASTPTFTPTAIVTLPKTGSFYYNLFLFAIGTFVILFSMAF